MATGLFNLKQVNQAISQGAWSGYIAPKWVEYLVVAGGGGAGYTGSGSGGGGAGGLLTGIVTVAAGTSYTVTVGSGGAGSSSTGAAGATGSNSAFGSITSSGGGGGGSGSSTPATSGGSGGGATGSGYPNQYVNLIFGQGISGQGNRGGNGAPGTGTVGTGNFGGGGGGAGTAGIAGVNNATGNGGAGIASSISGSVVIYAGGGAGGTSNANPGVGGVGGGGNTGATPDSAGGAGSANTGGGGGGGQAYGSNQNGGAGGSGIVVVRYPGSIQFFTGGTLSYANGYMIHTFYASGTLAPTTPTPYVTDYQISRSLRFNSADSAYLNRTPASASNQKTWTWSGWIKRGKLDVTQYTVFTATGGQGIRVNDDAPGNQIRVRVASLSLIFTPVLRDPSAWYHIVVSVDTTQSTSSDRVKLYINNQLAPLSSGTYPSQNADTGVNAAVAHFIGAEPTPSQYYDGLMTELNFIDGQALTPSSFGYTDPDTGVWSPLAFVGTYGTNGFYLNFSDNSNTTAATLGKDYSGNGNNWTPNNFSVTAGAGNDSLVDSPTSYGTDTGVGGTVRGNYSTLNPLQNGMGNAPTNGNLQIAGSADIYRSIFNTIGVSSGKWYFEVVITSGSGVTNVAWSSSTDIYQYAGSASTSYGYELENGNKINNGGTSAYGSALTTNDVFMCAADMDNLKLFFGKNGTWFASSDPVAGTSPAYTFAAGTYFFQMRPYTGSSSVVTTNFGQRPFAYTAPSGYKALCTQNLPTPTIGATTATQAGKYFNPVLYTGNGSSQTISGFGFQPDWVWFKCRSTGGYDNYAFDAVRGVGKTLTSNSTAAESDYSAYISAFTSDGYQIATTATTFNQNGQTFISWGWKANGSGSTNTAGSITSTVSANTTSGFSVVTYTGVTPWPQTIGHGLGVAPSMIIIKNRSRNATGWAVYHVSVGNTKGMLLGSTDAAITDSGFWNNTTPTSTVFTTGNGYGYFVNAATDNYVAYCFAEVAGYSKFGSYTGNGSSDGPFNFTGFRPAYVMIKCTNGTYNWIVFDNKRSGFNVNNDQLYPNASSAEDAGGSGAQFIDLLSNGFKLRNTAADKNAIGGSYIFAAFAEFPTKFSLAR